jgi:hypothetical protein
MLWIGDHYGKRKVRRISRQPYPIQIMIDENNWIIWNILTTWVA